MQRLSIRTHMQMELVDITGEVAGVVRGSTVAEGVAIVSVPHTTAGILINENADATVKEDVLKSLARIVPLQDAYRHIEGNSAAHIKTCLVGNSVTVPIADTRPALGKWQGIFLAEFDGPRTRDVLVQILPSAR
ncbi:MAG: secondary thiamine-phosphate synthase enzyme YjbQ [Planctomycetota bacterium]|nr:secondary thiamine-phosphate synthase enzyme YjbQ [Planctomycetota bacterium]